MVSSRFGDFQTIRFEPRGRVGLLTLHRPERLNAISARMMDEVDAVLDAAGEDDGIGAVVVCGAGRAFCSGYDLKDDAATPAPNAEAWRARLERDLDFLLRFWNHPKPTVAAVHGHCLAGGLELAMSCDITIAEEGCLFGEPELKFGSVIVNIMMPWLVGPKLAKELLLSGDDTLRAERAERIGSSTGWWRGGRTSTKRSRSRRTSRPSTPTRWSAPRPRSTAASRSWDCTKRCGPDSTPRWRSSRWRRRRAPSSSSGFASRA